MYIGKAPLPPFDYEDQGQFGTCVGNGIAHQLEYEALEIFPELQLKFSPLFIYRNAKVIEGNWDEGTDPALAYQALLKQGVCLEADYPYTILTDVHNIPAPSADAVQKALQYRIRGVTALATTCDAIDKAIDSGKVVNVGTLVTDNFVQANNEEYIGVAQGRILGGHDYVIIGRDDDMFFKFSDGTALKGFYHLQNSWNRQQTAWVAKSFIGEITDMGMHILEGAWIVDTGWQPIPKPTPQPTPVPTPTPTNGKNIKLWIGKTDVVINGQTQTIGVAPQLYGDFAMVPLRFISEGLGAKVQWDGTDQSITITE